MAEKPYTMVPTGQEVEGVTLVKWAGMQNTDTGAPFMFVHQNDRTVHVFGTFGTGGTVLIEGSLEVAPTVYATLNDPQGNALSFAAARIESVLENVTNIRPRVSVGDANTLLDVYLLLVK
jgi:hypothetical protein